ncbi:hypothetical protein [Flavobacterium tyrosinilyticum]|uniref:hypothetical protein n=1 Tax=Flavobacterium tyrosinilyticum TaxID=1658740 RepID=UPI002030D4A4|nr:hypothetical protein [Flavobacterium tyrosinilyticum]MCM0667637.1 hypothetical protein [Flavobacterium tyrosinilyticum]
MDLTINFMSFENEFGQDFQTGIYPHTQQEVTNKPNFEETNNAILRKVIENYDYNFQISEDGHCVVSLDREIENLYGIENPVFSGGSFLLGQTIREEHNTGLLKVKAQSSFLDLKNIKSRIAAFFSFKKLATEPEF